MLEIFLNFVGQLATKIMQTEIWKEISGYEGYFEVINLGNFTSLSQLLPNGATEKIKSQVEKKLLTLFTNLNGQLNK